MNFFIKKLLLGFYIFSLKIGNKHIFKSLKRNHVVFCIVKKNFRYMIFFY